MDYLHLKAFAFKCKNVLEKKIKLCFLMEILCCKIYYAVLKIDMAQTFKNKNFEISYVSTNSCIFISVKYPKAAKIFKLGLASHKQCGETV